MSVAQALVLDAVRAGVLLIADGDAVRFKALRPMPRDLADRLKATRHDVLAMLRTTDADADATQADVGGAFEAVYTPGERQQLDEAGILPGSLSLLDQVKQVFPDAVVIQASDEPRRLRRDIAQIVHEARRVGDHLGAVAVRAAWRERLAICAIDGKVSIADATAAAAKEIQRMVVNGQVIGYNAEHGKRTGPTEGRDQG